MDRYSTPIAEANADKVTVPLVVFRNHERFDPLAEKNSPDYIGPNYAISSDQIEHQAKKMLPSHQDLQVIPLTQPLSAHRHFYSAVYKALRYEYYYYPTGGRAYM